MEEDERLLDFTPYDEDEAGSGTRRTIRMSGPNGDGHLTKTGTPDRRFKGQRELPPEESVLNPNYVKPSQGEVLPDGTHITRMGKPDLRFKENRGKDEETVLAEWANKVYDTYGRGRTSH